MSWRQLIGVLGLAILGTTFSIQAENELDMYVQKPGMSDPAQVNMNERKAIGNLRGLAECLSLYHDDHAGYPDDWYADLYTSPTSRCKHLRPEFNFDLHTQAKTVEGYDFHYIPLPEGCSEPSCLRYLLTAVPHVPGLIKATGKKRRAKNMAGQDIALIEKTVVPPNTTGTKSLFIDESVMMRHCLGGGGAKMSDPTIDQAPTPCVPFAR